MRIVVAWDPPAEAARLVQLLTAQGHAVTVANNGRAAVTACLGETVDIAFVDLLVPGMDGFAVAREIRNARAGNAPRLVAITALRSAAAEEVAHASGYLAVLHKAYTDDDLQALLARITAGQVGEV